MTQAENEIIETFKRELALALRRITGRKINLSSEELPVEKPEPPVDPSKENPEKPVQGS